MVMSAGSGSPASPDCLCVNKFHCSFSSQHWSFYPGYLSPLLFVPPPLLPLFVSPPPPSPPSGTHWHTPLQLYIFMPMFLLVIFVSSVFLPCLPIHLHFPPISFFLTSAITMTRSQNVTACIVARWSRKQQGFQTRMVYLDSKTCLRYPILVPNPGQNTEPQSCSWVMQKKKQKCTVCWSHCIFYPSFCMFRVRNLSMSYVSELYEPVCMCLVFVCILLWSSHTSWLYADHLHLSAFCDFLFYVCLVFCCCLFVCLSFSFSFPCFFSLCQLLCPKHWLDGPPVSLSFFRLPVLTCMCVSTYLSSHPPFLRPLLALSPSLSSLCFTLSVPVRSVSVMS